MEIPIENVKLASDAIGLLRKGLTEDEIAQFIQFSAEQKQTVSHIQELINPADLRDQIIFGEPYNAAAYRGGLRYFKSLRRHELLQLMENRIYDPYPWTRYMEYVWFFERYGSDDQLYLHGFVYSPERKDGFEGRQGGIAIEGIGRDKVWIDKESEKIFTFLFGDADEFRLNPPYAWFD